MYDKYEEKTTNIFGKEITQKDLDEQREYLNRKHQAEVDELKTEHERQLTIAKSIKNKAQHADLRIQQHPVMQVEYPQLINVCGIIYDQVLETKNSISFKVARQLHLFTHYDADGNHVFIYLCSYMERDYPKQSGFVWNPDFKLWMTNRVEIARCALGLQYIAHNAKEIMDRNVH